MANTIHNINNELDNISLGNSSCSPDDCHKYINPADSNVNVLHINIRSVNKNFNQLQVLLNSINIDFDAVILTECWLSKVSHVPVLDGFKSHTTVTNSNQNDGVIIYTRLGLQSTVWEPDFEGGNCLICQINQKLTVVVIYRSPSLNSKHNFESFTSSLNGVYGAISSCPNIALIGDINIDIRPDIMNDRIFDYLTLNASHGLLPTHLFPTRLEHCIDHILLKSNLPSTTLVLDSHITDHKPILLSVTHANPVRKVSHVTTCLDYEAIISELEETDFSVIYHLEDVNAAMNEFVNLIKSAISKHSKQVKVPRRKITIKPWMTPGLLRCIQNRDKMHMNSNKDPHNEVLKITYTRYRNFCNELLRKLRTSYETNELEKGRNNPKKLWTTIKKITNTQKIHSSASELLKIHDNPKAALNKVSQFFCNVGKNLAENITSRNPAPAIFYNPSTPLHFTHTPPVNSLALLDVDEAEVESLILQLRSDCSVGWDGISSFLLKSCRHILVPVITYLCNRCLDTGTFPDALKRAVVHPIYKSGDRNCVNNYRPIAVLPALSKILERILNNGLKSFLNKHHIIAPNQYGFRSGVSTEDAILDFTQQVAMDLDNKTKCLGIFLDFSKAFDTVSVPKLILKLESIGVRGKPLQIFTDYLNNRSQCVKIDKYISDETTITYGVPQGSILGPTLFQIYVNELCKLQLPKCKIYAYADDTAVLVSGSTWDVVKTKAEAALSEIMQWLNSNLLTLNLQKTNYISFAIRRNTTPPQDFSITAHSCLNSAGPCDCPTLIRTNSVKYLGVLIDDGLKWDRQIDALTTRTLRLIHIFKSLRESANADTIKMVYYALCQSVLGYCITAWGGAWKTNFLRVERAQRAILKVMSSKPYRYPTTDIYSDCMVLTVRQLFVLRSVLRKHACLPLYDRNKRTLRLPRIQHKTSFAKHQYYILSTHLYQKIHQVLGILDLNTQMVKSKVTEWLLQKDYAFTESLVSFIA